MDDARDTWPLAEPGPRIATTVKRSSGSNVNVRALTSVGILVLWAALTVIVSVASAGTAPSQFDYDNGATPPSTVDRQLNILAGAAYILSFPVSLTALWLAVRSLRRMKEQVSSTIAVILAGLASLASIGVAAVGVGTLVFFT